MLFNLNLNFCLTDQCFRQSMRKNNYHTPASTGPGLWRASVPQESIGKEMGGLKKINFVKNKQTVILPSWWENIHFQGKWIMVWHFTPQKWFQSHLNSVLPKTRCLGMIVIMSWWHAPLVCLCQPFLSYYLPLPCRNLGSSSDQPHSRVHFPDHSSRLSTATVLSTRSSRPFFSALLGSSASFPQQCRHHINEIVLLLYAVSPFRLL